MMLGLLLVGALGGHAVSYDAHATLGGVLYAPVVYPTGAVAPCTQPNGMPVTATAEVSGQGGGGGGGVGGRVNYMYLGIGERNVWAGFRAGAGVDALLGYASSPGALTCRLIGNDISVEVDFDRGLAYFVNVPLFVGGVLALGKRDVSTWHGVIIGIAYAPTAAITKLGTAFNYAGAELSFDFATLEAARTAQFRLALFALPPVAGLPLFASLSLGARWY